MFEPWCPECYTRLDAVADCLRRVKKVTVTPISPPMKRYRPQLRRRHVFRMSRASNDHLPRQEGTTIDGRLTWRRTTVRLETTNDSVTRAHLKQSLSFPFGSSNVVTLLIIAQSRFQNAA